MNSSNTNALRQQIRQRRRQLPNAAQRYAAQAVARKLARMGAYRNARSVAAYIANDGEISPQAFMRLSLQRGKSVYLPCLTKAKSLLFRSIGATTPLQANRYGIPEPPRSAKTIAAHTFDVVLVPLVAFDHAGRRIGMGGGYYDRTFAFKRRQAGRGPVLIGLAHSCQEVDHLHAEAWDVPLDWIVTEKRVIRGTARRGQ